MRIRARELSNPNGVEQLSKAHTNTANQVDQFSSLVAPKEKKTPSIVRPDMSKDVQKLAQDVASGTRSQEDIGRAFVEMVMNQRPGLDQFGKGKKEIQEAITEIIQADPIFVSHLHAQLKKIARG